MTTTPARSADWRPQLIALDLDGTTLNRNGQISPRMSHALQRVAATGCQVVFATGRASFEVVELLTPLQLPHSYAVCSNGAVVAQLPTGRVIHATTFDPAPVLEPLLIHFPNALIGVELPGQGYLLSAHFPPGEIAGPCTLIPPADLLAQHVVRAIIRDPSQSADNFVTLTSRLHIAGASHSVGFQAWLDIGPPDVSKATGLQRLTHMLNIDPLTVLAIGDGRNDIEMLLWAGHGVAMGHAPAELRAVADTLTGPIDEDGAAAELERWLH